MDRDQKFFDMYSLVIGALAIAALGIFVLAMKISDNTQGIYTRESAEYQGAVAARIRPFGDVYMPGEEGAAAAPLAETVAEPEPVAAALSGPQVYNSACLACHGANDARPEFVKQGYPEDKAFDFEVGDLRGLYSVFVPDPD